VRERGESEWERESVRAERMSERQSVWERRE